MIHKIKRYFLSATAIIAAIAVFQSCTKTEYIDYEKEPRNKIAEYRITNAPQTLLGAIDNDNNVITVYIPYYLGLEHLIPAITLEDKTALIFDEEGKEILLGEDGAEPVALGTDTVRYTVKTAEGISRTYAVVQKVLPHPEALTANYSGFTGTLLTKPVNARLTILGNFESTSLNGKFYLTNKATGEVHDDWVTFNTITAGNQYNLTANILAKADAGNYSVKLEHQGRTVNLPDLQLKFQKPYTVSFFSSASYAAGDTITFSTYVNWHQDVNATVFLPVKKAYIKLIKGRITPPAGFSEALYNTPIEMKIVSQSRTELKAIFPQMPAGTYMGNTNTSATVDGYSQLTAAGFGFYADFEESTGWGNGHLFTTVSMFGFTVK